MHNSNGGNHQPQSSGVHTPRLCSTDDPLTAHHRRDTMQLVTMHPYDLLLWSGPGYQTTLCVSPSRAVQKRRWGDCSWPYCSGRIGHQVHLASYFTCKLATAYRGMALLHQSAPLSLCWNLIGGKDILTLIECSLATALIVFTRSFLRKNVSFPLLIHLKQRCFMVCCYYHLGLLILWCIYYCLL